jgi:hypothetical protein
VLRFPLSTTLVLFSLAVPTSLVAQSRNTTLGTNAGSSITTGDNNTIVGHSAGSTQTTASNNSLFGRDAGTAITSGGGNTIIGASAGAAVTTASDNTFVGSRAGVFNTSGEVNTFVGEKSGENNDTGSRNTFVGQASGQYGTTGSDNSFFGYRAGYGATSGLTGSHNTALGASGTAIELDFGGVAIRVAGDSSGSDLRTAVANTLVGAGAGFDIGGGIGNTCVGYASGAGTEAGRFNTFLGTQAGYNNDRNNVPDASDRNTYVGFDAGASQWEGTDNVGVGAFADVSLDTVARTTFVGASTSVGADETIAIGYGASAAAANSTAIGVDVAVTEANHVVIGNSAVTSIGGPLNWTALSDGRLKRDVREDVPGLDFVRHLRPVSYAFDAVAAQRRLHGDVPAHLEDALQQKASLRYTGFIAQDVAKAADRTGFDFSGVDRPAREGGTYGLRYAEFVVPLTRAVQELDAKVEAQAAVIEQQAARIRAYERMLGEMAALAERVEQLESVIPQSSPN